MKKGLKIATVALATVMAGGTIGALAGCGGGGGGKPLGAKNELTVSIFCNPSDAATNTSICDQWAKEYNAAHPELGGIKVNFRANTDKGDYFKKLDTAWSNGSTADIIYLSPKYVRTYAERGNVLDLSQYLSEIEDENGTPLSELASDVWQNGISYYGYIKGKRTEYSMGRPIKITEDGKFVTATGTDANTPVGIYGLPKDYSNFSTGYNRLFFSPALIEQYTTQRATTPRNVKPPEGEGTGEWTSSMNGKNVNYVGGDVEADCITYAVANEDGGVGDPAHIINVGIPTTYKPYNFFKYPSFREAVNGRDPVAVMSEEFGGYTVTIPGFPTEIFENLDQTKFNLTYTDGSVNFEAINVPYNKTIAHMTYTYAEYGALIWACTYYLNTFAWDNGQKNPLNGNGGKYIAGAGTRSNGYMTVYGGEQYEGIAGATGSVLYLLPWLAANNADLINDKSNRTRQAAQNSAMPSFEGAGWRDKAGKDTYDLVKTTLADTQATKKIQYGHDSENFIETYAAFLAIGSDWNGNPAGDTESKDRGTNGNGWGYFRAGRSLFYGAGSWDAATRNDVSRNILDFGQMPTPISEKYALYSEIKGANYEHTIYSNDPAKAAPGSDAEAKQRTTLSAGLTTYDADEILANQLRRQDKWAARMDTVGYAVSAKVEKYKPDHAWKKEAAISLAVRLTINKEAQKTLLYAGAQLPNFVSQCTEFVDYKNTKYADGDFADMITPDGGCFDTPAGKGEAVWAHYYKIATDMEEAARKDGNGNVTVKQFLQNYKHHDGTQETGEVRYNHAFENTTLGSFTGSSSTAKLAFAMKILNMVAYRAEDRDINIRMQYGLNAVRDSSMYTYKEEWMGAIDARDDVDHMLAYRLQKQLTETQRDNILNFDISNLVLCTDPSVEVLKYNFWTPAVWCFQRSARAQQYLINAMIDEQAAWAGK